MIDIRNLYFYTNSKSGIGNSFYGSHNGMRFAIIPKKTDEIKTLELDIWPEPWARDITPPEKHIYKSFDLTEQGFNDLKNFLIDTYKENEKDFKKAANMGLSEALKNRI